MDFKEFLRNLWRKDNHSKYQRYFEEWYENLTEGQIAGFMKQKQHIENNNNMEKDLELENVKEDVEWQLHLFGDIL